MARGCGIAAPCTHENPCPMLGRESSSWCHFVFSSESAPGWLVRLSRQAGLPKTSAALSFVLAGRGPLTERAGESARIVSEPFRIESSGGGAPGRPDYGSYGCSPKGLVLLAHGRKHGAGFESGREIDLSSWRAAGKDCKSGAALLAPKSGS